VVRALRESFPGVTFVRRVGSDASSWGSFSEEGVVHAPALLSC
jgi:hypothetical protein